MMIRQSRCRYRQMDTADPSLLWNFIFHVKIFVWSIDLFLSIKCSYKFSKLMKLLLFYRKGVLLLLLILFLFLCGARMCVRSFWWREIGRLRQVKKKKKVGVLEFAPCPISHAQLCPARFSPYKSSSSSSSSKSCSECVMVGYMNSVSSFQSISSQILELVGVLHIYCYHVHPQPLHILSSPLFHCRR